jgi:hypothetical protein
MRTNPFIQVILFFFILIPLLILSLFVPSYIVVILNYSFYVALAFGIILFVFNIFYFYNCELRPSSEEYEKIVIEVFLNCIAKPFTYTAGIYSGLIVLKLNICDYQYISEIYSVYDRGFMIGAMILLLIYLFGKSVIIIKKQIDFWHSHISEYKGVKNENGKNSL